MSLHTLKAIPKIAALYEPDGADTLCLVEVKVQWVGGE